MGVFGRPRARLHCRDGGGVDERENMTLCNRGRETNIQTEDCMYCTCDLRKV